MIDLTEHEGFIYNLIKKWKVEDQDKEDVFQDFFIYFTKYANYNPTLGAPTTFLVFQFKFFMLTKLKTDEKYKILDNAIHIEERDSEFLERELDGIESMAELDIYIHELLKNADDVTLDLITGDASFASQAKKEGVTRQAVSQRHKDYLKKITERS